MFGRCDSESTISFGTQRGYAAGHVHAVPSPDPHTMTLTALDTLTSGLRVCAVRRTAGSGAASGSGRSLAAAFTCGAHHCPCEILADLALMSYKNV